MADQNSTPELPAGARYRATLAQAAHVNIECLIRVMRGQVPGISDGWHIDCTQADELAARLRALASEVALARITGPEQQLRLVRCSTRITV